MDNSATATKQNRGETFEQIRIREQTHARLRLHNLMAFLQEHDGKWMTAWECNFVASLHDNQKMMPSEVITERQQSTLEAIYSKLQIAGKI